MLIENPIAMVRVSRIVTKHGINRWANVVAATIMTAVQTATLFAGTPTAYYLFFSVIEIATTGFIAWYAWRWHDSGPSVFTPTA